LSEWLAENGCTHVAKPVWHILDDGDFQLILANAAHVKNVPGRKTDVNDGGDRRLLEVPRAAGIVLAYSAGGRRTALCSRRLASGVFKSTTALPLDR
jgi:hypothetical protein